MIKFTPTALVTDRFTLGKHEIHHANEVMNQFAGGHPLFLFASPLTHIGAAARALVHGLGKDEQWGAQQALDGGDEWAFVVLDFLVAWYGAHGVPVPAEVTALHKINHKAVEILDLQNAN